MTADALATYFPPSPIKHGRFVRLIETRAGKKKDCITKDAEPATLDLITTHLCRNADWRALGYLPGIKSDDGEILSTSHS